MTSGQRVAFYRRRRGLTQLVLAGLIGRTEDWLRKVEHDALPLDRLSVLRRLAFALDVSLGDLIGEPVLMAWADEAGRPTVPALRVALMDHRQFLTGTRLSEPVRMDVLVAEIAEQWSDYQNSRYARLTQRLPLLITDAQAACQHYDGGSDDGLRAHELAASAHQLTTAFLTKLGEADLAAISASRGLAAAHTSESALMIGSLYRMELGDVQVAVELGPSIDTHALPTERRVRHAIETARAYVRWNRVDDALSLLLHAEQDAPEQVRYHRLSRTLVREMIRLPRPASRAVDLACRMGVHGTDPREP